MLTLVFVLDLVLCQTGCLCKLWAVEFALFVDNPVESVASSGYLATDMGKQFSFQQPLMVLQSAATCMNASKKRMACSH